MRHASTSADLAAASNATRSLPSLYADLTKARLSTLVVMTTVVGFAVAPAMSFEWLILLWTVIGTALAAGSANALNQVIETRRDALMHRTQSRPIPSGAMSAKHAFVAAMVMGYAGIAVLAMLVNLLSAGLALLTIVLYVAVYTPLKPRSTTNTLVGAVCGAIPPMIGWAAATGTLDARAWLLGAVLFVWQLPHFFALAWLYREDYARGGYRMLPVLDPSGRLTAQVVVVTTLMLLPIGLLATMLGIAGWIFALGSVVLTGWMLRLAIVMYRERTDKAARAVFMASLLYLPLVLGLMVIDRGPVSPVFSQPVMNATLVEVTE